MFAGQVILCAGTIGSPQLLLLSGVGPAAFVDAELRVRGVERLRVIDASVMPTLISGATHAATVTIAEKGADLIKRGA